MEKEIVSSSPFHFQETGDILIVQNKKKIYIYWRRSGRKFIDGRTQARRIKSGTTTKGFGEK